MWKIKNKFPWINSKKIKSLFFISFFAHYAFGQRPNILFILTDDQNTNTIGCYNNLVYTPNIDNLTTNGIKFNNANVVSTMSSPSRYNILTGRYYNNSYSEEFLKMYPLGEPTCINNFISLEKDNMNVAAILKENGYNTGFVGKFHLTDHFLLFNNNEWEENGLQTYPKTTDPRLDKVVDLKMKLNHQVWCDKIKKFGFNYSSGIYAANLRELFNDFLNNHNVEWTVEAATEFLEKQKNDKNPFFLFVSTTYPHGPAPEYELNGSFPNSLDHDIRLTGQGVDDRLINKMSERDIIKQYYSDLKKDNPAMPKNGLTAIWWDNAVGEIIKKLVEIGKYENTLIIYTSDHGQLNGGKTTLYETGVRVPLIMSWPKKIKEKTEYDHIVASIDFVPTILDVCQVNIPEKMKIDGISLNKVIEGCDKPVRDVLFLEMGYARGIKTERYKYIAVRYPEELEQKIRNGEKFGKEKLEQPYLILQETLSSRAAKANKFYFDRNQIYDLKEDPEEKNNICGYYPELDSRLYKLLSKELNKFPHRPFGEFN